MNIPEKNDMVENNDKIYNDKKISDEVVKYTINKKSEKHDIAIKFLNALLKNLKTKSITIITEFQEMDREDLIKPENELLVKKMEDEIFEQFDKSNSGYYRRSRIKNYILTFLRYLANEFCCEFKATRKDVTTIINGKGYRSTHYFYSIIGVII